MTVGLCVFTLLVRVCVKSKSAAVNLFETRGPVSGSIPSTGLPLSPPLISSISTVSVCVYVCVCLSLSHSMWLYTVYNRIIGLWKMNLLETLFWGVCVCVHSTCELILCFHLQITRNSTFLQKKKVYVKSGIMPVWLHIAAISLSWRRQKSRQFKNARRCHVFHTFVDNTSASCAFRELPN